MSMPACDSLIADSEPGVRERVPCLSCGSTSATLVCRSAVQMGDPGQVFDWMQCTGCGLVYLSPRVPAAEVGAYYSDYLPHRGAGAWGKYAPLVEAAQRRSDRLRLRTVRRVGTLSRSSRLLDVGCGHPTFLRLVRDETGAECTGTDFDTSGWDEDPARWQGLSLHAGELEQLPLTGPYDRMTLWHVLEHLYDPLETLRYLRQLARPGTQMIIEVPDHSSISRKVQGSFWAGYHTPRHTAAYTPATLRVMLERAGWTVARQYQHGTLDTYAVWWLGQQERQGRSLSVSLENRFVPFVLGRMASMPLLLLDRWIPLGLQTAIAVA